MIFRGLSLLGGRGSELKLYDLGNFHELNAVIEFKNF